MEPAKSLKILFRAIAISTAIVFILILCTISLFAQNPESEYFYQENKRINKTLEGHFQISDGDNWVFVHRVHNPESNFTATLAWEIPSKKRRFNFKDNDLPAANAFYHVECDCAERGYHQLTEGTISGNRGVGAAYMVNVNVVIHGAHGKNIKVQFWEGFDRKR